MLPSIGNSIRLVRSEADTTIQLVPSPVFAALVCTCRSQPRWSAGQDNVKPADPFQTVVSAGWDDRFVTAITQSATMLPSRVVALMVVDPGAMAVTNPDGLTVAMASLPEVQATDG